MQEDNTIICSIHVGEAILYTCNTDNKGRFKLIITLNIYHQIILSAHNCRYVGIYNMYIAFPQNEHQCVHILRFVV